MTVFQADRNDPSKNIPVITLSLPGNRPSAVAVSPDFTRAYVANRADGTLSVIDTLALQQVTARPAENIVDIELARATPFAIAMDPLGRFAFVTDSILNIVTVVDINPQSPDYHKPVYLLHVPGSKGLTGIAVSRDGASLFVAATNRKSESEDSPPNGHVFVFDIRPAKPAAFKRIADLEVGDYPYGLTNTPDPDAMLVTNFLSDANGVQVIRRQGGAWLVDKNIDLTLGRMASGAEIQDSFDVNN